jgi:hypothetical protein
LFKAEGEDGNNELCEEVGEGFREGLQYIHNKYLRGGDDSARSTSNSQKQDTVDKSNKPLVNEEHLTQSQSVLNPDKYTSVCGVYLKFWLFYGVHHLATTTL